MNREKSRTVSVFAIRNFKFLGFCFGKNGKGIYIRVHGKSWKKAKDKLRQLTSRSRCGSIIATMGKNKSLHAGMAELLRDSGHEEQHGKPERMAVPPDTDVYLEQWKLPRTRMRKLIGLGVDSHYAATIAYDRKGYWFNAGSKAVNWTLSKERLINWGFYDLATAYQSVHVNY